MYNVSSQIEFLNKIEGRSVILIKEGESFKTSKNVVEFIPNLHSISALCHVCSFTRLFMSELKLLIVIYFGYFFIMHRRSTVLYDTAYGNKKHLSSLSNHYSSKICNALLGLHTLAGCDTVNTFKGKGKVRPMKLLLKSPDFCDTLSKLGEPWKVTDELVENIEKFVAERRS